LHLHGAFGSDLCDASINSLKTIAEYELTNGITTICPATMSLPRNRIRDIISSVKEYTNSPSSKGASIAGINMEGPYINPHKCGAQNKTYISAPDIDEFQSILDFAEGLIKLVDISPEIDGAMEFVNHFADKVRISMAHTNADYDEAVKAFNAGILEVTHLGNAMPPMTSRMPGPIAAALENEKVAVELITDGIHIHPSMVKIFFKLFGSSRIILISDSMEACGLKDGSYTLGEQMVTVKGKLATLTDDNNNTIAGSVSNLMNCVKNAVKEMNIPLEDALKCASANPAKALGIYDFVGSLSIGKKADIVIMNKELDVLTVLH